VGLQAALRKDVKAEREWQASGGQEPPNPNASYQARKSTTGKSKRGSGMKSFYSALKKPATAGMIKALGMGDG